ncbi:MAG: polyprenyl synthetase family protein [Phycisphaerales bacterium]
MHRAAGPDIEAALTERAARAEAYLRTHVRNLDAPDNLRDAIEYALFGGGKLLRPALCLLACEACAGDADAALPAAGAVELVHAFSLVHDDLPAMDDDDLRRGRPTLHVRSGEALAILAGDAMLAFAFGLLARESPPGAPAQELLSELASASGSMIAGQVYDTVGGLPKADPEAAVRMIHARKTGALIRAACRMGARCAAPDAEAFEAVSTYGDRVGLMFQIVDDLVDVEQTAEHAGKRTGKDAGAGKRTYPEAIGVDASREAVVRLCNEAIDALTPLGERAGLLGAAARLLARRTR